MIQLQAWLDPGTNMSHGLTLSLFIDLFCFHLPLLHFVYVNFLLLQSFLHKTRKMTINGSSQHYHLSHNSRGRERLLFQNPCVISQRRGWLCSGHVLLILKPITMVERLSPMIDSQPRPHGEGSLVAH